jgi:hypothetical protein
LLAVVEVRVVLKHHTPAAVGLVVVEVLVVY